MPTDHLPRVPAQGRAIDWAQELPCAKALRPDTALHWDKRLDAAEVLYRNVQRMQPNEAFPMRFIASVVLRPDGDLTFAGGPSARAQFRWPSEPNRRSPGSRRRPKTWG